MSLSLHLESPDADSQEQQSPADREESDSKGYKRNKSPNRDDEYGESSRRVDSNRDRSPPEPEIGRRSSSPKAARHPKKARRKDAGFRWKEKRRDDEDGDRERGLTRGYRDHYKPRRCSRSRSRSRDRDGRRSKRRSRSPRRHDSYRNEGEGRKEWNRDRDRERDYDRDRDRDRRREKSDYSSRREDRAPKSNSEKVAAKVAPSAPQQEMILVTVNDRLGTKKQIPCLPNDTIKDFKAVVAMMIGRRPHEILLKRQSERPFKDFLTLQDYGVSNGASLDLEVDTGD